MKKALKLFIALLMAVFFSNDVKALETSFTENFQGFAIDYTKNINYIGMLGSEMLGSDAGNTYFKISSPIVGTESTYADGKVLYCADGKKGSPAFDGVADSVPFGECYIRKGTGSNDKSIAYVYENGYGNYVTDYSATDYLTGNWETDYYITQVAMWYFTNYEEWMNNFDFQKGTYNGQTSDIIKKISKLITDAKAANSGASLKMESSSSQIRLTEDGNYYITSPIKITGKYINSQITASVSGVDNGFVTTNKDDTSGITNFDNNSTIYIKVPVDDVTDSSTITLNISATSSIEESEAIECRHQSVEEYQPIIIFYPKNKTLTESINFAKDYFSVKITKTDITNSKVLEGATLTITDSNNTVIETWVTEGSTKELQLTPGTYILEETKAPEGYELSEERIEFTINSDGQVLIEGIEIENNHIVYENVPEPEEVETGNTLIYVAGTMCLVSLGVAIYFIIKRKEK